MIVISVIISVDCNFLGQSNKIVKYISKPKFKENGTIIQRQLV